MNLKKLIDDLDPITIIEFKNYLSENLTSICLEKKSNSKIISSSRKGKIYCKDCGSVFYKNGRTKTGVQKYICSGCKKTISETTGTAIYHSKLPFEVWSNVIDNLINGFSIRRIAEENDISILTSFRLRHKVLIALDTFIENITFNGEMQMDEKYFSINLKGTKPENMPRYSKKRASTSATYRGISHHKVCVLSCVDECDNLILKIGGLGRGTSEMLESNFGQKINNAKCVKTDSASAYQSFCSTHNLKLYSVPSGFHSNNQINIAEINNVHSQLETWLQKFNGVSTRHFQQYLNWFTYIFMMKKRFKLSNLKTNAYRDIVLNNHYINCNEIFKIKMPIDLDVAYAEFANQS